MAVIKIILLVLLGLFLLLLLFGTLALFFPFSYSVKGKGNGSIHFRINVHWLFYFLNFTIRLSVGGEKEPPKGALRILGIPLLRIPKKKKKPKKSRKTKEAESEQEAAETEQPEECASEENRGDREEPKEPKNDTAEKTEDNDEKTGSSKESKAPSKIKEILGELKDERNKAAVKKVLEEVKKILKLVFPKKFRLNLTFSTGDPANTGKLLGVACFFPPVYARGNRICPDFEADKAYLAGTFSVKGYIILITLIIPAVRMLLDKNVRRIIGKLRKKK